MTAGVRILHAADETENLDVYINERLCIKAFPHAAITQYVQLPAGDNWVEVFRVGIQPKALYRKMISVRTKRCYTVCLLAKKIYIVEDGLIKSSDELGTYLRFIHFLTNGPNVSLMDDSGKSYFINNPYMRVSPYRLIAPQTTRFSILVSGTRQELFCSPIYTFGPRQIISIYALGKLHHSSIKLVVIHDQESHAKQNKA